MEKGKYAEYAKAVFKAYFEAGANVYKREILSNIAEEIGLDPRHMFDSVDSGIYDEKLREAEILAKEFGIQSVPTFIINNRYKISGVRDYSSFKKTIIDLFNRLDP